MCELTMTSPSRDRIIGIARPVEVRGLLPPTYTSDEENFKTQKNVQQMIEYPCQHEYASVK